MSLQFLLASSPSLSNKQNTCNVNTSTLVLKSTVTLDTFQIFFLQDDSQDLKERLRFREESCYFVNVDENHDTDRNRYLCSAMMLFTSQQLQRFSDETVTTSVARARRHLSSYTRRPPSGDGRGLSLSGTWLRLESQPKKNETRVYERLEQHVLVTQYFGQLSAGFSLDPIVAVVVFKLLVLSGQSVHGGG